MRASKMLIQLHDLNFRAFHGVYASERINGNEFVVNADIEIETGEPIEELYQTLDYVSVYAIIRQRMDQPAALLETVAQDIASLIHQSDDRVKKIILSIKKLHPPIEDFTGSVGVRWEIEY